MRAGKPVVFADQEMPASIERVAGETGATLIRAGMDYRWTDSSANTWNWTGARHRLESLQRPALVGSLQTQNAAGALATVESLGLDDLLSRRYVDEAFGNVRLPGRMQTLPLERNWVLDVAHNPAAASALSAALAADGAADLVAIVGMLDDKDVESIVRELDPHVSHWIATTVDNSRGIAASELARRIANETNRPCLIAESADAAIAAARDRPGEQVLVTGSFYLVGPILARLLPQD